MKLLAIIVVAFVASWLLFALVLAVMAAVDWLAEGAGL